MNQGKVGADMQKNLIKLLSAVTLLGAVALSPAVQAADHLDSPGVQADPAADINDVYVFRSRAADAVNTRRTVFIMTVVPLAGPDSRLSADVEYRFRIAENGVEGSNLDIVCTATPGPEQMITCTGPTGATDTVAFNAIDAGDGNTDNMRIFVGLREDPFFFDLEDFRAVIADPSMVGLLLDGDGGEDFFAALNTISIVVDVKNEIFGSATLLNVQAVTNRSGLN
jgi:hypothetical protein